MMVWFYFNLTVITELRARKRWINHLIQASYFTDKQKEGVAPSDLSLLHARILAQMR